MAVNYHRKLLGQAYSLEFAEWEKQALVPKDIFRTPSELADRARIAECMRDLRRALEPALVPATVLNELRALVVKQTKALNCAEVWKPAEVERIRSAAAKETDWSRLLLWCRNTRRETMRRYDLLMAAQYDTQGYSDGWNTAA
ncbi:hypothetical protein [Hymenobacter tenuis]